MKIRAAHDTSHGTIEAMKNFNLPLPEETYLQLRAASKRGKIPATAIAREAIEEWLKAQAKAETKLRIAAYAEEFGGTEFDLDRDLEAASVDCLLSHVAPW